MSDADPSSKVAMLQAKSTEPYSSFHIRKSHHDLQDDEIDLVQLFGALWRGKWLISLALMGAVLLGGVYAFRMATPVYQSTSVVLLDTKQERITDIETVVAGMSGDTSEVNSEIEILRSRVLLGRVVDRLDLQNDPEFNTELRPETTLSRLKGQILSPFKAEAPAVQEATPSTRDEVISSLLSQTNISNIRNSLVFEITVESESAVKSALISDTIADEYTQSQLRVKYEATEKANAWLSNRVAELQIQLEIAEQDVSEFRGSTRLISAEVLQAIERQLKDLRERVIGARAARDQQITRLQQLERAETVEEKIKAAQDSALEQIAARMPDRTQPTDSFSSRFNTLLHDLRNDLQRSSRQLEGLEASEQELQAQIEQQSADLIRLQQLQREAQATRLLYEHFLTRLKETSAQQGIQQADSRIISQAVIPTAPISPKRALILALSAMIGIMAGAVFVLWRELRNQSFKTAAELETFTGKAVLGQIPAMPVRKREQILPYLNSKPTSAAAEAVRNLRTSILLSNVDTPPKVILMTSPLPGDGKTTSSVMLAHNFGQLGQSVLLIDGDLRRKTLRNYLSSTNELGLVSALTGKKSLQDVVQKSDGLKADCILAEDSPVNPADLFASKKFQSLMAEARSKYDVIIIDTAPVLVVPDARILAEHADVVLLSVRWDKTSRAQVEEALRVMHNSGLKISGLILNAISAQGMKRYGYGGKYGAYAAYGSKYYAN